MLFTNDASIKIPPITLRGIHRCKHNLEMLYMEIPLSLEIIKEWENMWDVPFNLILPQNVFATYQRSMILRRKKSQLISRSFSLLISYICHFCACTFSWAGQGRADELPRKMRLGQEHSLWIVHLWSTEMRSVQVQALVMVGCQGKGLSNTGSTSHWRPICDWWGLEKASPKARKRPGKCVLSRNSYLLVPCQIALLQAETLLHSSARRTRMDDFSVLRLTLSAAGEEIWPANLPCLQHIKSI